MNQFSSAHSMQARAGACGSKAPGVAKPNQCSHKRLTAAASWLLPRAAASMSAPAFPLEEGSAEDPSSSRFTARHRWAARCVPARSAGRWCTH